MSRVNPDKPLSDLEVRYRLPLGSPAMTEFAAFSIMKCQQDLVNCSSNLLFGNLYGIENSTFTSSVNQSSVHENGACVDFASRCARM